MLLTSIPIIIFAGAPHWILIAILISFGLVLLTYLSAYIYLLFNDRDALRSEVYTLSKMAIERGLMGDNITGLIEEPQEKYKLIDSKIGTNEEARPRKLNDE
ncbi:MAG: hypothetical protein WA666_03695 [Nitrospirota bacterium]